MTQTNGNQNKQTGAPINRCNRNPLVGFGIQMPLNSDVRDPNALIVCIWKIGRGNETIGGIDWYQPLPAGRPPAVQHTLQISQHA